MPNYRKENKNTTEIEVSVCIANFNGCKVLPKCIDSIKSQDCTFPVEIIIHDDASTDSSIDLIQTKYPEVSIIPSSKNVGFCISNNRMVKHARGKYILLLNNDAWLTPDSLSTLYDYAEKTKQQGILGLAQYDANNGTVIDVGSKLDIFYNAVPNYDSSRQDVAQVIGACMWMPRSLWNELGGFPVWFETLAEDLMICCKARLNGNFVRVLSSSRFYHLVGNSLGGGKTTGSLSTTFRRRRLTERNKTFVMIICTPSIILIPLFLLHLLTLFIEALVLSLVKQSTKPWREIYRPMYKDLWINRSRLVKERRKVQAHRKISLRQYFSNFTLVPFKLRMFIKKGMPEIN